MTVRGTITLAATALLLLLLAWRIDRIDDAPPPRGPALLDGDPTAVARVELLGPDQALVAIRQPGGWVDATGRRWPADRIDEFLATLGQITAIRSLGPTPDSAGFGLGRVRLRCLRADGSSALDLELGDENPSATGVYARSPARPGILIVGALLEWELKKIRQVEPSASP
jgi:hypothetical protein